MLPTDQSHDVTPVASVAAAGTPVVLRPDRPFKGQDYDRDMFALFGHPTSAALGDHAPIDLRTPLARTDQPRAGSDLTAAKKSPMYSSGFTMTSSDPPRFPLSRPPLVSNARA